MNDSPYIFAADESSFNSLVIDESNNRPVLVDFWAEWCAPCRSLMPVLAKLADEYGGKFMLAKVNSDENQQLAAQFGVRSLPTVMAFKNGKAVDQFMGALPESAVREFIERHIEREADKLQAKALRAQQSGDSPAAIELLRRAHQLEPDKSGITIDLASVLADSGFADQAETLLLELPEYERGGEAAALLARLEFAREAANLPDEASLNAKAEAGDLDALHRLALLEISRKQYAEAMDHLLAIIKKDRAYQDDLGRKTLLKLFGILGNDPLVDQYRKKMTNLLF